jgi:hypothetical protein
MGRPETSGETMTETKTVAADVALVKAQETLAVLERDHVSAVERQAGLAKTREKLALAGMSGGSARAQRDLQAATEESARLNLVIENLTFAIRAAREEVAEAEAEVRSAAHRENTAAALAEVGAMRASASRCTTALTEFLASFDDVIVRSNNVRRLGGRWPRHEVFEGSVRRALQVHLYPRHLESAPLLTALSSRQELDVVIERWIAELEISLERGIEAPEARRPVDYGRPPPLPRIPGEEFLDNEEAAAE